MAVTAHTSPFPPTANDNTWALETRTYGPYAAAALPDAQTVIGVVPFACDIEKISIRAGVLAGADADTIRFTVAASGVAKTSASNITAVEPLTTNANAALAADTWVDVPITGNNTGLTEGTLLCILGAGTIATLADLMVHVTFRRSGYRNIYDTDGTTVLRRTYPYTNTQVL